MSKSDIIIIGAGPGGIFTALELTKERPELKIEVLEAGKEKVTYIKMDAEKAKRVVEEHLKGGKVVAEYTIGYNS